LVSGHDHLFAKKINAKMGNSNWEELSPATGYITISNDTPYFMQAGLIDNEQTLSISDGLVFIKFISSPVKLAYNPTYLIMDVKDNTWNCTAISMENTKTIKQKDNILNKTIKKTNHIIKKPAVLKKNTHS
jgi:hypothetical protein